MRAKKIEFREQRFEDVPALRVVDHVDLVDDDATEVMQLLGFDEATKVAVGLLERAYDDIDADVILPLGQLDHGGMRRADHFTEGAKQRGELARFFDD